MGNVRTDSLLDLHMNRKLLECSYSKVEQDLAVAPGTEQDLEF